MENNIKMEKSRYLIRMERAGKGRRSKWVERR